MSLKATAKEFVPSFGVPPPSPAAPAAGPALGVPAAANKTTPSTITAIDNNTRARSTKLVSALKGLHLDQQQQQHQQNTHSKGESTQRKQHPITAATTTNTTKQDRIPGKDATSSKRGQRSQQQQQQQSQSHPPKPRIQQDQVGKQSSTFQESSRSGSQQNRPAGKRQERPSEEKGRSGHDRTKPTSSTGTTITVNAVAGTSGPGSGSGSGNTSAVASKRSGSTSAKGTAQGKRKGSLDQTGTRPSGQNSSSTAAAASSSTSATASGANTSSGSTSNIIPGMEPTAFICLTDMIQPVRHVVKDGVSTMEQGSDAYLDWVIRSLKEHEEITLIGMDAAIPDIISLVLRAGKQGIGYQEVRTFTTQDGLGGNKSCLQFRIQRGQGYIALEKRPPRS